MEPTEAIATPLHSGAIEAYGIEPIPEALKTVRWPDLFLLVSNFLVNPGTILIGGLAVASGLSFWATILTSTLGILIAFSAYIVMATVGVDYGITGQVACRMVFGIQGAKWLPSIMRTIASAYWFAMQTIVGATVFVAIAHQWTGRHHSVVRAGLILASVQVLLALVGYQWLKLISRFSSSGQSCRHRLSFLCIGPRPGRELPAGRGVPFSCAVRLGLPGGRCLAEQHDGELAHHDYRCGRFLPLHPQP